MAVATTKPTTRTLISTVFCFMLCGITPVVAATESSHLIAAAIGVEDLEAATRFYQNAMGLQEISRTRYRNRTEVTLHSLNGKGSALILMGFHDHKPRSLSRNPGKIVFYTDDISTRINSIYFAGGEILLAPTPQPQFGGALVGFSRDLDGNLLELVETPSAQGIFMSAFGVGVSNLESAKEVYTEALGFSVQTYLEIPGQYNEYILQPASNRSSALVLMHWTNGSDRNYIDNPIKLEIGSPQPWLIGWRAMLYDLKPRPFKHHQIDSESYSIFRLADPDGTAIQIYAVITQGAP